MVWRSRQKNAKLHYYILFLKFMDGLAILQKVFCGLGLVLWKIKQPHHAVDVAVLAENFV